MARLQFSGLSSAGLPRLIENTTIPLAIGGGFVSALALAILSVAFLGDPSSGEPSIRVSIGRVASAEIVSDPGVHADPDAARANGTQLHDLTSVDAALLTEQGPNGPLPVIGPDGSRVMDVFARPFDKADQRPRIAIIVTGLGLSVEPSKAAIDKLPAPVTLSFVPYSAELNPIIDLARKAGHEIVLEIPMEPFDYPENDPGPYALLTQLSADENDKRLSWIMSRFTGYAGVSNYLGGQFLTDRKALKPALTSLQSRGVYFLDTSVSPGSVGVQVAGEVGLVARRTDIILDVIQSKEAIDDQLADLERAARETGRAVGVAFIYPVTIERIALWAEKLGERGFALAPVSAMLESDIKPLAKASDEQKQNARSGDHAVPAKRRDDGH
jgi:uncharacterized protein